MEKGKRTLRGKSLGYEHPRDLTVSIVRINPKWLRLMIHTPGGPDLSPNMAEMDLPLAHLLDALNKISVEIDSHSA
jgi:hypothetical protein